MSVAIGTEVGLVEVHKFGVPRAFLLMAFS